jgi:hypothetical protein
MVEDGEGCNVGVERLGIVKVANPRVIYYGIGEGLDAALNSLIGFVVLDESSLGGFGANTVNERSFHIDCRVIAGRMGGWAYKGSTVVMKIAVRAGSKSPEIVDTVDVVLSGLEKDRQDGVGETVKIVI